MYRDQHAMLICSPRTSKKGNLGKWGWGESQEQIQFIPCSGVRIKQWTFISPLKVGWLAGDATDSQWLKQPVLCHPRVHTSQMLQTLSALWVTQSQGRISMRQQEITSPLKESCGCPIPGSAQDQAAWGLEKPGPVKDVPAHGWEVAL